MLAEFVVGALTVLAKYLEPQDFLTSVRFLNARLMDLEVWLNAFEIDHGRLPTDQEVLYGFVTDRFPLRIVEEVQGKIGGTGGA